MPTPSEFRSGIYTFNYDTSKYPFYELIQTIFDTKLALHEIHKQNSITVKEQTTFENDTSTDFHKKYYKAPIYSDVIQVYHTFIKNEISPLFDGDLVVQKEPSFRVHLPNNTALGKTKLDTEDTETIGIHCDGDYNHPKEEINFMLSITGQSDTNSCYAESQPLKGDFTPLKIDQGQFVSFYGNQCRHYNKKNSSDRTRMSFDFRVIPYSEYKETNTSAIHSGRKFVIGDYFMLMKKD
jgi:hypothetical protein